MALSYTDEELTILLTHLFVNMNNLDATYYDMFYNQTPMDVKLLRYNSNGDLQEYMVPNRAKDRAYITIGNGSPESVVVANVGAQYIDQLDASCYYKATGYDTAVGWAKYLTRSNFVAGEDYLTPTGSASGLKDLNINKVSEGVLSVAHGGTGTDVLNGILKGDTANNKIVKAVPGVDYLEPSTFVGSIVWVGYKVTNANLPDGWLVANGAYADEQDYEELSYILGTTWGPKSGSRFKLPDARTWMNNPSDKSTPLIKC